MDEVFNLDGDGRHGHLGVSHDFGDQAHEGVVPHFDHQAFAGARFDQGALEHQIFSLQGFVLDVFGQALELHGLSGQTGVVYLKVGAFYHSHVCGHAHSIDQVYNVGHHYIFGEHCDELSVAQHAALGRHLVFEGGHGLVGLELLPEAEGAGQQNYNAQHHPQLEVAHVARGVDSVRDEAQDASDLQQDGKQVGLLAE